MKTIPSCSHLSDSELRAALAHGVSVEREATAHVIALLAEFDRRRLYLAEGYRSLFAYCTDALHLSEDAAYSRIQAARASRKWPGVLQVLLDGSVTLTAVGVLAPHLTDANVDALLIEACHKSKDDVKLIVARLKPQPDVPSTVRRLPTPVAGPPAQTAAAAGKNAGESSSLAEARPVVPGPPAIPPPPKLAVIAPLAPERYKIQITVDRKTHNVLRQAQDLMRHSIPNGDPAAIIARALRVLVEDLLKKKAAATEKPGPARVLADGSRTVPAAVKRAVWTRDGGQCAFEGVRGRCRERGSLEYHHLIPYAMGGTATADNIELRCRAHNAYQASLDGLGWTAKRPDAHVSRPQSSE